MSGSISKVQIIGDKIIIQIEKKFLSAHFDSEVISKINHSSFPKIYYAFERENHVEICEKYINGETLDNVLKIPQSKRKIKKWIRQICRGVNYLHTLELKHIIHGDIKAENVIINKYGNAKIIDFSSSMCIMESKTQIDLDGEIFPASHNNQISSCTKLNQISQSEQTPSLDMIFATRSYCAPEVFFGEGHTKSRDIYALGVLIIRMICGEEVIKYANLDEIIAQNTDKRWSGLLATAYEAVQQKESSRCTSALLLLKKCGALRG